jgi:hypothetical protein
MEIVTSGALAPSHHPAILAYQVMAKAHSILLSILWAFAKK